jgi:hypothetical protein
MLRPGGYSSFIVRTGGGYAAWLESGTGGFHDTVGSRPMLRLHLPDQ